MIAYNVNIPGDESILPILNRIAARLRSSGDGKKAGRLKEVQAKPWFSSDFGMCQPTFSISVKPASKAFLKLLKPSVCGKGFRLTAANLSD